MAQTRTGKSSRFHMSPHTVFDRRWRGNLHSLQWQSTDMLVAADGLVTYSAPRR